MSTLTQLDEIPTLAYLVTLSADTPARGTGRIRRARTGSPIPPQVAAWDAMRDDEHGLRQALIEACLAVHDDMADDPRRPDMPTPTWAALCGFLAGEAQHSYWTSDDVLDDMVTSAVRTAHGLLSSWVGERKDRLSCVHCRGRIEVIVTGEHGGRQASCHACHHLYPAAELAHLARMATPATLPEIADMMDVTERTCRRWARAASIQPVTTHRESPRNPSLYLPSDFAALKGIRVA